MASTGGKQGKLSRVPGLGLFGACSGRSPLQIGEFTGLRCELSFAAPGLQVTTFAGLTSVSELFPLFTAEIRAGEIDNITGFGAS